MSDRYFVESFKSGASIICDSQKGGLNIGQSITGASYGFLCRYEAEKYVAALNKGVVFPEVELRDYSNWEVIQEMCDVL